MSAISVLQNSTPFVLSISPRVIDTGAPQSSYINTSLPSLIKETAHILTCEPRNGSSGTSSQFPPVIPVQNILYVDASADVSTLTFDVVAFRPRKKKTPLRQYVLQVAEESKPMVSSWIENAMRIIYDGVRPRRRLKVLVNPYSGTKQGNQIYMTKCKPIFDAARCQVDVTVTRASKEEFEIAQTVRLEDFDSIVMISGDGAIHHVVNGLFSRPDWDAARRLPIGVVPAGSGNAVSIALLGPKYGGNPMLAAMQIVKGREMHLDVCSMEQEGGERSWSFLSQNYGIIADSDLGTEDIRWMGGFRFTVGIVKRLFASKAYPCKLELNIESQSDLETLQKEYVEQYNKEDIPIVSTAGENKGDGDILVSAPMISKTSLSVTPEERNDESKVARPVSVTPPTSLFGPANTIPPLSSPVPSNWLTLDQPIQLFFASKLPYADKTSLLTPFTLASDGKIDILVSHAADMKFSRSLSMLSAVGSGKHIYTPGIHYYKVSAYRITPCDTGKEFVSIDGESVPCKPWQVEVFGKQGGIRLLSLGGKWVPSTNFLE